MSMRVAEAAAAVDLTPLLDSCCPKVRVYDTSRRCTLERTRTDDLENELMEGDIDMPRSSQMTSIAR